MIFMNDLRSTPLNDIEKLNDCNAALEQLLSFAKSSSK